MSGFLLDTNCISEIVRLQPDPKVVRWMDAADEQQLYLSVLVLGEIRKGASILPASAKRTQLERWLEIELPVRFGGRIFGIDAAIADRWGTMAGLARAAGKALGIIDGLLAATAFQHRLTVVTHNFKDFSGLGVPVVDPWESA